jgi:hypothetical protein
MEIGADRIGADVPVAGDGDGRINRARRERVGAGSDQKKSPNDD